MSTPDAPDPRKVAEAALEAFVYLPLGLALEAKDLLPKLTQRGRNQVVLARLGARFAIGRAEAEAERIIRRFQPSAAPAPAPGAAPAPAPRTAPATATAAQPSTTDTAPVEPPAARTATVRSSTAASPARARARRPAGAATTVAPGGELAIPGYDTLSASQVVPRLDALHPAELEAVRVHEASHRSRRTILSRIAQLQA
jgi:hypothetical protein